MKRILLLGALLAVVFVSACQPAGNSNSTTNQPAANANANKAAATVPANDIMEKERQAWEAIKTKNWDAFGALLTDDSILIDAERVYDKQSLMAAIKEFDLQDYQLADMKVLTIDGDAAVVYYTSTVKVSFQGKVAEGLKAYNSSGWVKRGDKWLSNYHQECSIKPSPTPGPAATPVAAATPAPATSAAPTASSTGEQVERAIWDALMRSDWDGFAAMLAPEAIEISPFGISDKAGSVAGVKQVNFAGSALSDFREMKIDDDARIVTYKATGQGPGWGPQGEQHTTIQVLRDGKWLAIFHHGTHLGGM